MTPHSTITTPAPAAGRQKSAFPLLGVTVLTAVAVLALVLWQRASESEPTAPPAPAPAAAMPAQTVQPFTFYLVETADDAGALDALLQEREHALVAGTAEEAQQAYAQIELMRVNVPDREVLVIDRRSS